MKDAQEVHPLATVGSSIATVHEGTVRFIAAVTDWFDQHRLDRLTVQQQKYTLTLLGV